MNGKTATDFSGIVGAAEAGAGAGTAAVGTEIGAASRFDTHRRSTANPAMAKPIRDTTMIAVRFDDRADDDGAGAVGEPGRAQRLQRQSKADCPPTGVEAG